MEISRLAGLRDAEFPSLILHESDDLVFDLLAWRSVGDTSAFCPGGLTVAVENETVDTEILESLGRIGIDEPVGGSWLSRIPDGDFEASKRFGALCGLGDLFEFFQLLPGFFKAQMPKQPSP